MGAILRGVALQVIQKLDAAELVLNHGPVEARSLSFQLLVELLETLLTN